MPERTRGSGDIHIGLVVFGELESGTGAAQYSATVAKLQQKGGSARQQTSELQAHIGNLQLLAREDDKERHGAGLVLGFAGQIHDFTLRASNAGHRAGEP